MERTPFYNRGSDVRDALYGPIIPSHLDPEYKRRTFASIKFEGIHGRVPQPGDILRYEEVAETYRGERIKAEVERVQGAWARRLPETPCPFRYEEGKMLIHQDNGTWKANWGDDVPTEWCCIEDEAFGRDHGCYLTKVIPELPTIEAVVFIESKDGKRRTKPFDSNTDLRGPNSEERSA